MWNTTTLQVELLVWCSLFCMIAAICMGLSNNFEKEKRNWMLLMQASTSLLLGFDALAYVFRGKRGIENYYMVRISNFSVFLLTDIALLFFHMYVCTNVLKKEQREYVVRVKTGVRLAGMGIIFVVLSQFTDLYYYFDENNFYHRNTGYFISMLIPVIVMLIDLSLMLQYRKRLSRRIFISMLSYIVLPLLAALIQMIYYGISFINISIGASMIIMFLAAMGEQNRQMYRLLKKNTEVEARLEIATTLNRCVGELSSDTDIQVAIFNLLHAINDYFHADRTYIFEADYDRKVVINTHEYTEHGVSAQMDNLQAVPMETVDIWMQHFQKDEVYYMPDLEQERGHETYNILKDQDIQSLLAVPLWSEGKMIGFLGVDNPKEHYDDPTLLSSIKYFISNSLSMKKQQEWLEYLSYRDMLTKLYNRNKYIDTVESYEKKTIKQVGAAYVDLNGLKKVNDQQGHEAGDHLIQNAANAIASAFPDQSYRVGGDEFVILVIGVGEEEFLKKIDEMEEKMKEQQVSISIGPVWKARTEDLEKMLKDADALMYEEKEKYHKKHSR